MSHREFTIVAPDTRMTVLVPALSLVAALVAVAFAARTQPLLWAVMPPVALVVGFAAWGTTHNRISIDGRTLRVVAGLHRHRVDIEALDLDAARVLDLRREPALRPIIKAFGTSMPGYQAGHFRLRNRSRAFLLVTDRAKTLLLPERTGRTLLLTPERPQALLEALRAVAERGTRR